MHLFMSQPTVCKKKKYTFVLSFVENVLGKAAPSVNKSLGIHSDHYC